MENASVYRKFCTSIHMGSIIFRYYQSKIEDKDIKEEFEEIMHIFKRHEDIVKNYLIEHKLLDASFVTKDESMAIFMEKIKLTFTMNDHDVVLRSIKAIHMATIGVLKFINRHDELDDEFKKIIQDILSSYDEIAIQLTYLLSTQIFKHSKQTSIT